MACNMTEQSLNISNYIAGAGGKFRSNEPGGSGAGISLSATVINFCQINLSWTPQAGKLLEVLRSTDSGVTWHRVYLCHSDDGDGFGAALVKLTDHDPATNYYYSARHVTVNSSGNAVFSVQSNIEDVTTTSPAATKYVGGGGASDSNDGSTGSPWASLQHAIDTVSTDTLIWVRNGTYTNSSRQNDSVVYGNRLNTESTPIQFRAENKHLAIIDGEGTARACIHVANSDYLYIRGLRCTGINWSTSEAGGAGVFSWDLSGNPTEYADVSASILSKQCVLEEVLVDTIDGVNNIAAFGPWGSERWIMRGCETSGIATGRPCLETYNAYNLLIEQCDFSTANGIFNKDHLYESYTSSTVYTTGDELCIRYTDIDAVSGAAYFNQTAGAGNQPPQNIKINNSRLKGTVSDTASGAVLGRGMTSSGPTGTLAVTNCFLDNPSGNWLRSTSSDDHDVSGNIIKGTQSRINTEFRTVSLDWVTSMKGDHNLYITGSDTFLMGESDPEAETNTYTSLANWVVAQGTVNTYWSLDISVDDNSIVESLATTINNYAGGDFTLATGSAGIALLPDNRNVGMYEFGIEQIGLFTQVEVSP